MFISSNEKAQLKDQVMRLDEINRQLIDIVKGINDRVGVLEKSAEKRKAYGRDYYAKKKAEKAEAIAASMAATIEVKA